jgi:predicted DNA binding protein
MRKRSSISNLDCALPEGTPMSGNYKAKLAALKELQSGKSWYRGAQVRRLSEEEAGIIAARLVRRVQAKTTLAQDKAEQLERVLTDAYRKRFAEENYEETLPLRQLAGDLLDEKQIAILEQAIDKGYRPLPNEQ